MSPPTLALALAVPAVLLLLYAYTAAAARARFPTLWGRRVCLLIAHPDDEAMFFAPAVLSLTRPASGNSVRILCLSTGDADGLGDTRRRELRKSARLLGVRGGDGHRDGDGDVDVDGDGDGGGGQVEEEEDAVEVIDSPDFPDSMTKTWDATKISDLLCSTFAPHLLDSSSSNPPPSTQKQPRRPPTAKIDVLITFDSCGVSSHPNHISLYHGARAFVGRTAAAAAAAAAETTPVELYTLTSVPVYRKYTAFLDAPATLLSVLLLVLLGRAGAGAGELLRRGSARGNPGVLVSVSDLFGCRWGGGEAAGGGRETYGAARRAMTEAHRSQMVWFRWGWILLSRYMYVNDLRLEHVEA